MLAQGITGIQTVNDGNTTPALRAGRGGELIVSELSGRFYEQCYRGNVYAGAATLTSISNATFTTATTGATATPIVGVWNPAGSGVNLVMLQGMLQIVQTALQHTGIGGCMWMVSTSTVNPTTGTAAFNRKTLTQSGGQGKYMGTAALTGMTGTLAVAFGSTLGGGSLSNVSTLDTAASQAPPSVITVENFDGSLIVPPGSILSLQCVTTPVAFSAAGGLMWMELPV